MQIEFDLNFKDFKAAQAAHRRAQRTSPRVWISCSVGCCLAVPILYRMYRDQGGVVEIATLVFAVLFAFSGLWLARVQQIKRLWRGHPNLQTHNTYHFSEAGVETDDGSSQSKSAWSVFHKSLNAPTLILLYTSDYSFHIIPKRAFPSADALADFIEVLNRHIQPRTQAFPVITPAEAEKAP